MTNDMLDLSDAIEPDEIYGTLDDLDLSDDNITLAEVKDRIYAALRYSQELFTAGANPEYWRGKIDAFSYALNELKGVTL